LLAHKLGKNITLDEGNLLRKVLTKKGTGKGAEVKERLRQKFVEGCVEKGISNFNANKLWQTFEYFSGYGFNKSHAISYSLISYQCAWLYNYFPAEWMASFLDKEPETRKEKAINIAKSHGFKVKSLNVNTSGMTWEIMDDTTLVAPLTTIKGLGEKAIEQILDNRPFMNVEEFLFNENIVYSKLNKKAIDVLCRAGAMKDLNKPRSTKKLNENIEVYAPEGSFKEEEKIEFLTDLTGMFPFHLVCNEAMNDTMHRTIVRLMNKSNLEPENFTQISSFDPEETVWCFCIVRSCILKKTKNGKPYYIIEVIDRSSTVKKVRCWGIDPESDKLQINRPYLLRPKYNDTWGFSTRGKLGINWILLR
jgi:DNA polymerase III alpha subunit